MKKKSGTERVIEPKNYVESVGVAAASAKKTKKNENKAAAVVEEVEKTEEVAAAIEESKIEDSAPEDKAASGE